MAINIQGASAYFNTTTFAQTWGEYSSEQKTAAIVQAKRELGKAVGRPMKNDEPPYVEGDTKRDEYAVYEQALYTLVRDALPMGGGAAIPSLETDEKQAVSATLKDGVGAWSRRALNWLADKVTVVTVLGS